MKLFELKSSVDWQWDSKTSTNAKASFNVGDDQARVTFDYLVGAKNPGWLINFHVAGNIGVTGGGNAFLIFATVVKIVKEFIETMNPTRIAWGANESEPSRIKLYNRLGKMLEQTGWKITTKSIPGIGLVYTAEQSD